MTPTELKYEGAVRFENVDHVVGSVGNVDVAVGGNGQPVGAESSVVHDGRQFGALRSTFRGDVGGRDRGLGGAGASRIELEDRPILFDCIYVALLRPTGIIDGEGPSKRDEERIRSGAVCFGQLRVDGVGSTGGF